MKKLLLSVLAVAFVFLLAEPASAFFFRKKCCPPPCCDPCCAPLDCATAFVDKVVTCYKPVWKEEQVECIVNKLVCREVVEKVKCTVLVPRWLEEKRLCTFYVSEPVEVLQDIVRCRLVPAKVADPCCGYSCYQAETYVEKVKCVIHQCKPVQKEVSCKVCRLESQEQVVDCKRLVTECVPTKVLQVRRYCVLVPYQTTVRVPVCLPVGAPVPCH